MVLGFYRTKHVFFWYNIYGMIVFGMISTVYLSYLFSLYKAI
jgi:hypothetical protein